MSRSESVKVDTKDPVCAVITWKDGHISRNNVKWMRFHCHCDRCFRSFSGMYPLDKPKFPDDFKIESSRIEDQKLFFTTDHEIFENHESHIPLDWLRSNCNCKECIGKDLSRRQVHSASTSSPEMDYEAIAESEGMLTFLLHVLKSGYCSLRGVPDEDRISLKISERIGPTFSGVFQELNDYKNCPEGIKQYSLHQDMPFYEVQPGAQVFYVKKHAGSRGVSFLVDLHDAAETLREESPDHFAALTSIPGTFEYKDNKGEPPVWYETQKPHIEVDYFGKVVAIHWNPAFEGPLRVHAKDVISYCKAHNAFANILKRKEKQIRIQLKEGDLVVLNNHRMAHSHDGYLGPDDIAIKSYLNIDDLKSTCIVLAHKLGRDFIPIKVGNRSSF